MAGIHNMQKLGMLAAAGVALSAALVCAAAQPAHAFLARPTLFAAIGAATKAPSGWQQFCTENADECRPGDDQARDVVLTPDQQQPLYETHHYVNDRVSRTSDEA